uniref:Uncharacterized protein n=3 Tax=Oryza TaxID=4527 RepID=A0A0D3F6S4_9ORYZ
MRKKTRRGGGTAVVSDKRQPRLMATRTCAVMAAVTDRRGSRFLAVEAGGVEASRVIHPL